MRKVSIQYFVVSSQVERWDNWLFSSRVEATVWEFYLYHGCTVYG